MSQSILFFYWIDMRAKTLTSYNYKIKIIKQIIITVNLENQKKINHQQETLKWKRGIW